MICTSTTRDDGGQHHIPLIPVEAVADGHVAQSARANSTRHSSVAQEIDGGDGHSPHQGGKGFRQQHMEDDLAVGGAHSRAAFHHALIQLAEGALDIRATKGMAAMVKGTMAAFDADEGTGHQLVKG